MAKLIDITGKALSGEWGTDDDTGNGIPVLRTTNFTNEGVVNYDSVVTRAITKKSVDEKYLRHGDIILEKSGGSDKQPVGRVIYFDGPENTYLFNNFTGLLRVKNPDQWLPRYVFYSLYANYRKGGTREYENKTTGLHNLKTDVYVSQYEVTDALYDQQRLICERLDKITDIIHLRKKELQQLDNLIKARFVEMFGDPVINNKSWKVKKLKDVCVKLNDGTHFSPESFETGDYKYITAKNIKIGGFDFSNITYLPEEVHRPIYERCNPEYGDVLYIKDGVTTGIAMINTLKEEFSLLSSVALLKQNREILNGYFLCGVLNNNEMYQSIRENMGGAAITRLTIAKLNNIKIILPSMRLQNDYAEFVKQVDKSKFVKINLVIYENTI
jgi:type I restriction enzyme S subunit